jgi:predicted enzyme related to lactoylglutathione lyase
MSADGAPLSAEVTPGHGGASWVSYVRVSDCEAAVARALTLGATVVDGPRVAPAGRAAKLRDPEGVLFGVVAAR